MTSDIGRFGNRESGFGIKRDENEKESPAQAATPFRILPISESRVPKVLSLLLLGCDAARLDRPTIQLILALRNVWNAVHHPIRRGLAHQLVVEELLHAHRDVLLVR